MLSIVLYGRNDSYGYNLHKRAALSFNCMAELLSDPDDEILFVDYNTPDDYPTFPEAIADTLTDQAIKRLRILRVRPAIHARYKSKTHLAALEPIARNVAVRRSNPNNRWILSTNTDMIFVPRVSRSLAEMAAALPDGYYHLPRFEIPESLWEGFDRKDPRTVISLAERFGRQLHLNEIVLGGEAIKFDAPGDFQLMLRSDLFRVHGFHEEMLRGWHVDSNIAKRLFLIYGKVGDLSDQLYGYHCDHTRQVTPAHKGGAVENSIASFVDEITLPEIAAQAASWGCADDSIEEVSLTGSAHHHYAAALTSAIKSELSAPLVTDFRIEMFGTQDYEAPHVMPFLVDAFAAAPKSLRVAWIGARQDTFALFCDVWTKMGFRAPILLGRWSASLLEGPQTEIADEAAMIARADAFIFDFGRPSSCKATSHPQIIMSRLDHIVSRAAEVTFECIVAGEQSRVKRGLAPRRVITVDTINNLFDGLVNDRISAARAPFSTRLRQGFALPAPDQVRSVFPQLRIGTGGQRVPEGIASVPNKPGHVFHGPYAYLHAGKYAVKFILRQPAKGIRAIAELPSLVMLEVTAGSRFLKRQPALVWLEGTHSLTFTVPLRPYSESLAEPIEFRLWRRAGGQVLLKDVILKTVVEFDRTPMADATHLLQELGITKGPSQAVVTPWEPQAKLRAHS